MSEPVLHIPLHCRNVTSSLAPAKITYFICAAQAATKEKYSTCTTTKLWLYWEMRKSVNAVHLLIYRPDTEEGKNCTQRVLIQSLQSSLLQPKHAAKQ